MIFSGSAKRKNVNQFLHSLNSIIDTRLDFKIKVVGNLQKQNFKNLAIEVFENIPDDQLNALMYHSHGLIYPSVYEGFGYPLVHAMAYSKLIFCGSIPINIEILHDYEHSNYFDVQNLNDVDKLYQKLLDTNDFEHKPIKIHKKYSKDAFELKMIEVLE